MRILYITTIGATMGFFESFISRLIDEGHTVDIATNETDSQVPAIYRTLGCNVYQISCSRSPFKMGNIKAIGQIKRLAEKNRYDIVHCHTPIAAACTRLACRKLRKKGTKVFYTAHGFHFFDGAPLKNWMIYYPVEKLCAHFTDVLITINAEDYERAKNKLKAKRVEYVSGVGVDIEKFASAAVNVGAKRKELGIPSDAFLLLATGEVNENKNHQVILRAMAAADKSDIHFMIAGKGNQESTLLELAKSMKLSDRFHLLGYRKDINELCAVSDVLCFPSRREGLGLSAIEGMIYGLPLLTSNVHGINDYSVNGVTGFKYSPDDVAGFAEGITKLYLSKELYQKISDHNRSAVSKYDIVNVNKKMLDVYSITEENN